jgi:putative intracellular protease/amidase
MAEFNEEIDMYTDGKEGGPFGSTNIRHLLAKRFIHGDINNISCSTTFRDPTQFVLDRLREMAFRTAVVAATVADPVILFGNAELAQEGLSRAQNWTQNVDLIGQRHVVAYTVSIPFLACAIACSLLAVVAIVPLYWKARSEILVLRSFNPLDVAHVFDAPLLEHVHEKDMETYVRKEQGLMRVRCSSKQSDNDDDVGAVRILPEDRDIAAVAENQCF